MSFDHIAGRTSTYSKGMFLDHPGYPQQLARAYGSAAYDADGNKYRDWWNCLGANILGYNHPAVNDAIRRQLSDGIVFSLPHRLEEETAALLCNMAGTEQVRFTKNGGDATEAAVRLARKVTDKCFILTVRDAYHGPHSDLVGNAGSRDGGVLAEITRHIMRCPSPEAMIHFLKEDNPGIACVIAEPIQVDGTIWPWAEIKDACHKAGALLIFDEVITGFRYGPGSAVNGLVRYPSRDEGFDFSKYTLIPDLYCFGKAIANGMPLACVSGPRNLMKEYEHEVFFSSTAAAECLSLAACKTTLEVMQREPVHEHLWKVGQRLIDGWSSESILWTLGDIKGLSPRTQLHFPNDERRDRFLTGMVQRGHLLGRDNFITYAHTEEQVDSLLAAAGEVLSELT